MSDFIKLCLYILVAIFIFTFSLPIYEAANEQLNMFRLADKTNVNPNIKYTENVDYYKIYKYVEGSDAIPSDDTDDIVVNGKTIHVKKIYKERSTVYDVLTLLNTFCIQGKYMDCDRLYFKDRYITKASSRSVSLNAALANLDVRGDGKYVLVTDGRDCRFVETEGDSTIYVRGE